MASDVFTSNFQRVWKNWSGKGLSIITKPLENVRHLFICVTRAEFQTPSYLCIFDEDPHLASRHCDFYIRHYLINRPTICRTLIARLILDAQLFLCGTHDHLLAASADHVSASLCRSWRKRCWKDTPFPFLMRGCTFSAAGNLYGGRVVYERSAQGWTMRGTLVWFMKLYVN